MRIALTGVSGFIGSCVARDLSRAGHQVTGLVRSTSRRDHLEGLVDRFVVGTQDDERAWDDLLDGADALVHNSVDWTRLKSGDFDAHLASNVTAALRLVRRAPRVVFVSTIAVHHDMRPRWGGVVDEDHPTRPGSWYGAAKATVEAHLWAEHFAHDLPFAAVRPCAVYGIDPDLARSIGYPIVGKLRSGQPFTRAGGGKFVHVDDVAAVIRTLCERTDLTSGVYNLVDCYARWADWAAIIAEELGVPADIDFSSPEQPQNAFDVTATRALGVPMNRGRDGIRAHARALIAALR